jgi:hypothetical protein
VTPLKARLLLADDHEVQVALREELDLAILFLMLVHGVAPAEIRSRLGMASSELQSRRREIVRAIAPTPKRATVPPIPLDYERSRRRRRYRATG